MSHLHWSYFANKDGIPAPHLITKKNMPKGWKKARTTRTQPHPIRSDPNARRPYVTGNPRWTGRRVIEKSVPSGRSNLVMYLDHTEVDPTVHRDLLEDRVMPTSTDLEATVSVSSSSSTTSSLIDKFKSALHLPLDQREKPVFFGPEDNRGWLQRYAQRRNAKKREIEAYKETKYQITIGGRRFTAWTSGEHGWVAVPTLAHPTWKEKLPLAKKMPDIYSFDRFDTADARYRRVDHLLDDLAESMKGRPKQSFSEVTRK